MCACAWPRVSRIWLIFPLSNPYHYLVFGLQNGTLVPMGKPVPSGVDDTSLLYNEYIVYDTNQILMRYLIQVKFEFKSRRR